MTKAVKDVVKKKVLEEECKIAYSGPAVAANRSYVSLSSGGARLAFTEQQGKSLPVFRNAVMLSFQEAIALKNVLADLLKDIEAKTTTAK
jgi:hypothetical protein